MFYNANLFDASLCAKLSEMSNKKIIAVVATDKKGVIGKDDRVPWRIRDDLVRLKNLTKDNTVILGRKTYQSMLGYYEKSGREMPGEIYLVVTKNRDFVPGRKNARAVYSPDEAINVAEVKKAAEVYVLGGGAIFEAMLPFTTNIYLTKVDADVDGDAFFPEINMNEWKELSKEHNKKDDRNEYDYDYITLEKL